MRMHGKRPPEGLGRLFRLAQGGAHQSLAGQRAEMPRLQRQNPFDVRQGQLIFPDVVVQRGAQVPAFGKLRSQLGEILEMGQGGFGIACGVSPTGALEDKTKAVGTRIAPCPHDSVGDFRRGIES